MKIKTIVYISRICRGSESGGCHLGDNQEQCICFCDDEGPLRSVLLIGPWGEGDPHSNLVLTAKNGVKMQVNFILRTEFLRFVHE